MAISFPLALSDFYDHLPIRTEYVEPGAQMSTSGTEGGTILRAEVAPALWRGSIVLQNMDIDTSDFIASRLSALDAPGRFFFATIRRRSGPQNDPDGSTLGAATPTLEDVDSSGQADFSGLPAGYKLTRGDLFSFVYGGKYALHRLTETGTADGSGDVSNLLAVPPIRPGWSASTAITLVNPICKAVIVPGSVNYGTVYGGRVDGMSFEWRQTL